MLFRCLQGTVQVVVALLTVKRTENFVLWEVNAARLFVLPAPVVACLPVILPVFVKPEEDAPPGVVLPLVMSRITPKLPAVMEHAKLVRMALVV